MHRSTIHNRLSQYSIADTLLKAARSDADRVEEVEREDEEVQEPSLLKHLALGAGAAVALPAITQARYELFDLPGYRKQIDDLVGRAEREGTLFDATKNPLTFPARFGDVVVQGRTSGQVVTPKSFKTDLGGISTGASGSPYSHSGMYTGGGGLFESGESGHAGSGSKTLGDAFRNDLPYNTASIVLRSNLPADKKKVNDAVASMYDTGSIAYDNQSVVGAGLKRMLLPWRSSASAHTPHKRPDGTFCSSGVAHYLGTLGHDVPDESSILPPDLINVKDMRLAGIALNGTAMRMADPKLKGQAQLADVARKTLHEAQNMSSINRRIMTGVAAAGVGVLGAAAGGAVYMARKKHLYTRAKRALGLQLTPEEEALLKEKTREGEVPDNVIQMQQHTKAAGVENLKSDYPNILGDGLGALASDIIPFVPTGARRAGAASVLRLKNGEEPSWLLRNPILAQLAAAAGGGLAAATYLGATANNIDETKPSDKLTAAAIGLAPMALVQLLKHKAIRDAEEDYLASDKHTRLADIEVPDTLAEGSVGSYRLGAIQAADALKNRRLRSLSTTAETMDVLPMVAGVASLPVTQVVDQLEGDGMKRDIEKSAADTFDQSNAPVLAAMALTAGGSYLASKGLINQFRKDFSPSGGSTPLEREKWDGLTKEVYGEPITIMRIPDEAQFGNAFHAAGRNFTDDSVRRRAVLGVLTDPYNRTAPVGDSTISKVISKIPIVNNLNATAKAVEADRKLQDSGLIAIGGNKDIRMDTANVIAHEAGHAVIDKEKSLAGFAQRELYMRPWTQALAPIAGVASVGVGLATKNPLLGALAGAGLGGLAVGSQILPEAMASIKGLKALKTFEGGAHYDPSMIKRQAEAWGTYALSAVPAVLGGAAGGFIGWRREKAKRKRIADAYGIDPEQLTDDMIEEAKPYV